MNMNTIGTEKIDTRSTQLGYVSSASAGDRQLVSCRYRYNAESELLLVERGQGQGFFMLILLWRNC